MNTRCPACGAKLGLFAPSPLRCPHCGTRLAYNPLPRRFVTGAAALVLAAVAAPWLFPETGPMQPPVFSALGLLLVVLGLRRWSLYRR